MFHELRRTSTPSALATALTAALLVACGVEGTDAPAPTATAAAPATTSLQADDTQAVPPAPGAAVPGSPFGDASVPGTESTDGGRLGSNGDTLGNAGDPSVLPSTGIDGPAPLPGSAASDPSGPRPAGSALDADTPTFTANPFTGFWESVDPIPSAPREVLRIVERADGGFPVSAFLDRAERAGDAPGNCFESADTTVHGLVDAVLRPVTELDPVGPYEEYTLEAGLLVLTRYAVPLGPGRSRTFAPALPGLAAGDIPVCDVAAG